MVSPIANPHPALFYGCLSNNESDRPFLEVEDISLCEYAEVGREWKQMLHHEHTREHARMANIISKMH